MQPVIQGRSHSGRSIQQAIIAVLPLLVSSLLTGPARAETAVQVWVQRYDGLGNANDYPSALAVDSSNNVIVVGSSPGSGTADDYTIIKYSSAGVPLWTNCYNGSANNSDRANAVAIDANDDVIVTGSSFGGRHDDYLTIKYTSIGVALWTNRYSGNGNNMAQAVMVDANNDVLVTGYSWGTYGDYATIKYASDGVPLWTNRYNGPGNGEDYAKAVAVDRSGNVIVTGYAVKSSGNNDYVTIHYSSAGVPLWTNIYARTASSDDKAQALTVDGNNNVIVTGSSSVSGFSAAVTIKYSDAGVALWTNRHNMPGSSYDYPSAVVVDGSNNVIVTGYSYAGASSYDYATIKYSSAGLSLWTNRYNGPANGGDYARAVVVDGSNDLFITGFSAGTGSGNDYTTIKYSSAGTPLWTKRYNGPANGDDRAVVAALDHAGNVIVAGYSTNNTSGFDFAVAKYICVPEPVLTGFSLDNGDFQLRADALLQPGTLVIEASTNLTDWAPVFTNTALTNAVWYTDPDADSLPTRFYRAFQFP
jgi:uncharacterized delta-60 repeat protein